MKTFFHCFLTSNSPCTNVKAFRSPILCDFFFYSLLNFFSSDCPDYPKILELLNSWLYIYKICFPISHFCHLYIPNYRIEFFHFYQIILISMNSYFMNVIISLICLKQVTVILRHFLLPEKTSVCCCFFSQLHFSICLFGFLSSVLELFFRCLLILHNLLMIKKRELKSDLGVLCTQQGRGDFASS